MSLIGFPELLFVDSGNPNSGPWLRAVRGHLRCKAAMRLAPCSPRHQAALCAGGLGLHRSKHSEQGAVAQCPSNRNSQSSCSGFQKEEKRGRRKERSREEGRGQGGGKAGEALLGHPLSGLLQRLSDRCWVKAYTGQ